MTIFSFADRMISSIAPAVVFVVRNFAIVFCIAFHRPAPSIPFTTSTVRTLTVQTRRSRSITFSL